MKLADCAPFAAAQAPSAGNLPSLLGDPLVNWAITTAQVGSLSKELVWYINHYDFDEDNWTESGWGFWTDSIPQYVLGSWTDNPLRRIINAFIVMHECPPTAKSQADIVVPIAPYTAAAPSLFDPFLGDESYEQKLMLCWAESMTREVLSREHGYGCMYCHCFPTSAGFDAATIATPYDAWLSFYASFFFLPVADRAAAILHECRHAQPNLKCSFNFGNFEHNDAEQDPDWSFPWPCGEAGAYHYQTRYLVEYSLYAGNGLASPNTRANALGSAIQLINTKFANPAGAMVGAMNTEAMKANFQTTGNLISAIFKSFK